MYFVYLSSNIIPSDFRIDIECNYSDLYIPDLWGGWSQGSILYRVDAENRYGTNYYATVYPGRMNEGGGSRIELSPKKSSENDTFLNAMYVTDADRNLPDYTKAEELINMISLLN